ncbi:MAG TPA: deoxyuridine 5'-triphosphate nucleotidohydrolase [Pyrodictium sp.]|nr:deoxyuridine 5'-triphosphate nucleotidohydrolase [Pyrodictium sp.]
MCFLPDKIIAELVSGGHVQPAGVDLTVAEVHTFRSPCILGVDNKATAETEPIEPKGGFWRLEPGVYRITFNEIVRIPEDAIGFCYPRSTLIRSGVTVCCAVWDPGYIGRGQAMLLVLNPHGLILEVGAPIAQLVLAKLTEKPSRPYRGTYYGEGLHKT